MFPQEDTRIKSFLRVDNCPPLLAFKKKFISYNFVRVLHFKTRVYKWSSYGKVRFEGTKKKLN